MSEAGISLFTSDRRTTEKKNDTKKFADKRSARTRKQSDLGLVDE